MKWPWSRSPEPQVEERQSNPSSVNAEFGFPEAMSIALRSIPKSYSPYVANKLPAVKKAVQRLAFDVSSLPVRVEERMEVEGEGSEDGKIEWVPVYAGDPEAKIVSERWTPYESSALGIEMMMRSLAIYGITVVNVERDGVQLSALEVYDPRLVTRVQEDYGPYTKVETVIYGERIPRGRLAILYWEQPEDRTRIRPPLGECWAAIRAGLCATAFAGGYFDYAALGRLLLKPPEDEEFGIQRKKKKKKADEDADERRARGRNDVMELEPGWDAMIIPVEARDVVTEMRKFAVEEVSRIIGPPQPLVDNLDRATYSNIDGVKLDYRQALVATWAMKIGTELSRAIWPSGNRRVRLLVEESLLYSRKERLEANEVGIRSGQLTQNEAREREEMKPLDSPGADDLIRNPQIPVIAANVGGEMPMTDAPQEAPQEEAPVEEGEME